MAKISIYAVFALCITIQFDGIQGGPGSCGQSFVAPRSLFQAKNGRIVGGQEAKPHSLPWQVALRFGKIPLCGGTLIRSGSDVESDIVISAAHCHIQSAKIEARLGAHNREGDPRPGEQRVKVAKWIFHEKFNKTSFENDISIMKLAQPVKFSQTIQPACLPAQGEQVPDNTFGIVSGWGDTSPKRMQGSDPLMQVTVGTINSANCKAAYRNNSTFDIFPTAMICAGYLQGKQDACQGDSGGPLVFSSSKGYTLQGVVSFGEGCARAGKPGVYARVGMYVDWINQKVKELSTPQG